MKRLLALAIAWGIPLFAQEIRTERIVSGIAAPTDIQNAADGSGRLFFVSQNGIIRIFRNGALAAQPFLDITAKTHADGERGLLGLAFPPGFAQKQRFYVDYTDLNGDTVIAQYRVTSNPDVADGSSETVLLHIAQPFPNHNGGQVRFGPDGYLYIGMGDGGSGGDPFGNGQNLGTLLGKLLRIDVESVPGQVRIPADNPFVTRSGARGEIWAYGLRNPWRYSFDRATGDLWIADVGQDSYEEVDFQPAGDHGGENYGWNLIEGTHCYQVGCSMQGLTLPIVDYSHANGCAITGGFVYRGRVSPGLRGIYLYGDLCSGTIWGIEHQGSTWVNRQLLASGFSITTFGEDEAGEVYVANASDGTVNHILGSSAPRVSAAGVVNSASYATGVTAGSIATAFAAGVLDDPGLAVSSGVPLDKTVSGVTITVNGTPAPIWLLANSGGQEQVNFQVSFEVAGKTSVSVAVTRSGQSSAVVDVPVLAVQPAAYVMVHNADYTLVTPDRPLERGEYAYLYATGLGAVSNQPPTGSAAPSGPLAVALADVRVTLAGLPCEVPFAGLSPGLVGIYQVNFRVPQNAPSGMQMLVLSANGLAGPVVSAPVH